MLSSERNTTRAVIAFFVISPPHVGPTTWTDTSSGVTEQASASAERTCEPSVVSTASVVTRIDSPPSCVTVLGVTPAPSTAAVACSMVHEALGTRNSAPPSNSMP